MSTFNIPTREEVSPLNQELFDGLKKKIGMVPNLYATLAYSDSALKNVLDARSFPSSLSNKEQQIINLGVSQTNDCKYCLAAHTAMGKRAGLTQEQTLEVRAGHSTVNERYNALAALVVDATQQRGHLNEGILDAFFKAGYSKENLMDVFVIIGIKTISNYVHSTTKVAVDFPAAAQLELEIV